MTLLLTPIAKKETEIETNETPSNIVIHFYLF